MSKYGLLAALMMWVVSAHAIDVASYIPEKAIKHITTVQSEQVKHFPDTEFPHYFAGLIEHESCISLTHSRCWDSTSQLLSKREQGVGLGQITRTFNPDGTTRFDSLTGMRKAHMAELSEVSWDNVKSRPDLQIRMIMLMTKDNYKSLYNIPKPYYRLNFADAAYNGGLGGVQKERRICGLKADCDPNIWFNHVEKTCAKSTAKLYGNRSACDINRHHVRDVFYTRMPKYRQFY